MYAKGYGIITTLAPLHVGATAGEESGNLNLIFRDPYTQTGIIPGSSIRGRFRAEMRYHDLEQKKADPNSKADEANKWYGHEAESGKVASTTESRIKFEYASIVWLPVFCPGQPVVWVSCPRLLGRYKRIAGINAQVPEPYIASNALNAPQVDGMPRLFFNFGFLNISKKESLKAWFPDDKERAAIVVDDNEIGMVHDMALFRQSRVKLEDEAKRVDTKKGGFFNTEALPEETIMAFPFAARTAKLLGEWPPFETSDRNDDELYFGGLESVGFGHCLVNLKR